MKTRMTTWEVEAFTAFVRNYMPMDMRHEMMQALPGIYNKLVEAEVMVVKVCEKYGDEGES